MISSVKSRIDEPARQFSPSQNLFNISGEKCDKPSTVASFEAAKDMIDCKLLTYQRSSVSCSRWVSYWSPGSRPLWIYARWNDLGDGISCPRITRGL